MHLKGKDWRRFWCQQRLWKLLNGQVIAILARSLKTRIFWKSAKGGRREIFQKSLKSSLRLKGPKALCRKGHYPRFWRIRRIQKCPNGQVMAIFARSPKPAFSEKVQRGDQGKFFKNRPKSSLRLKGPKALWRKWHYARTSMHLKCKDWRRF